uniref:Leucine rich repeat containing 20 n=1 Tax=Ficedula albicollis TaxID=59894 RepID=A0A803VP44_FICAL
MVCNSKESKSLLTTFPSLDLDRNKLRTITGISKLCNLKKLILSKNEFVDFPNEIQSLVCLERLELNQNQIRTIPEGVFSHLPRLKHLRLNNNRLCALPRDLAACLVFSPVAQLAVPLPLFGDQPFNPPALSSLCQSPLFGGVE